MNDSVLLASKCDGVLADLKATPFGWPAASLDPGSGRRPSSTCGGTRQDRKRQNRVSTVSGDCRLVGQIGLGGQIHTYKSCVHVPQRRADARLDNLTTQLTERHWA